jgi:hypothetical protein
MTKEIFKLQRSGMIDGNDDISKFAGSSGIRASKISLGGKSEQGLCS